MAVKIRLRKQGKTNRPCFRIVVADTRSPRDGGYVEMLGWYNPQEKENNMELNGERLKYWLGTGAQISPQVTLLAKKLCPEALVRN